MAEEPVVAATAHSARLMRVLSFVAGGALLVAAIVLYPRFHGFLTQKAPEPPPVPPVVTLVEGTTNSLRVEKDVATRLGIRTANAMPANVPDSLKLNGSLTFDTQHLQEVRSRFEGEVTEIGKTSAGRELQFGDQVKQGQLLAVIWSRELGEKKSELVDAISQLHLDSETLKRMQGLFKEGALPEREYRETERQVENDRVALARVLRTLQTWRISEEEIQAVQSEAQRLIGGEQTFSTEQQQNWARVEIRSTLDGTLLEHNLTLGEYVTTSDILFKVGNLSRFRVVAYAYEEDLSRLDSLPSESRQWTLTIPADPTYPGQKGTFEQIGHIIDPAQHTAMIMGWVENPDGYLRAGQFITATVDLPAPGNEVLLPASAVIEKGGESLVFVQTDDASVYSQRRVSVSRQVGGEICVHIAPPRREGQGPLDGLQPGEMVVVSGALELQQSLVNLTSEQQSQQTSAQAKP